eukprot:gene9464-17195_t
MNFLLVPLWDNGVAHIVDKTKGVVGNCRHKVKRSFDIRTVQIKTASNILEPTRLHNDRFTFAARDYTGCMDYESNLHTGTFCDLKFRSVIDMYSCRS